MKQNNFDAWANNIISFSICELKIFHDDITEKLNLYLEICFSSLEKSTTHKIMFFDIQNFSLRQFSSKNEFYGLSIIDHATDGYTKDNRFEFFDYEHERIHFFCSCYKLIQ